MSNKFLSEEHTNLPKILTVTALLGVCGLAYAATTIINTTPKLTTGDNEDALFIFEDDSTIVNTSTVTTLGISADALRIDGLHARITNTATGELITQGEHFAVGIRLGRETAVVDNAGSITTSGSNGDGIVLFGGNGYVTNSGSILVQGTGADGFVVEGANTTLINSGSIQSTGAVRTEDPNGNPIFDDATGVFLAGSFNRLDNHAGAVIETTGPDANSLNAHGNGSLVNNHGLISSTGLDSRTVSILGNSNQTSVLNNTGEIINSGDRSSANSLNGLAVANFGPALLIDNSGLIESTSANGVALYSRTWPTGGPDQPDTFVLNSGLISASGVNSQATILLIGSDQFIENLPSGVIQQLAAGQPAIMNPSGHTIGE